MSHSLRPNISINWIVIILSTIFWIVLVFDPLNLMNGQSCHIDPSNATNEISFSSLMMGWTIMVLAMMLPKLISPIVQIYEFSLKRKRLSSSILFVLGYTTLWVIVGFFMNLVIVYLYNQIPGSYVPALIVGFIAVIWQISPIKQHFLNKGHDHRALKAFGWEADLDAFVFGLEHGTWCFGAGWALMWFPMLLPQGQNITMFLIMFIMVSEHMEHPQIPSWKINYRLKLWRIFKKRTQMRLGIT